MNSSSTQHDQVLEQNNLDFNQHEISDFDLLQKIEDDIRYGDIEHYDDDPDNNPTPPKDQKKKKEKSMCIPPTCWKKQIKQSISICYWQRGREYVIIQPLSISADSADLKYPNLNAKCISADTW